MSQRGASRAAAPQAAGARAEPQVVAPSSAAPQASAPPVALYVHVPFCRSICPYCDFVVYAGTRARGPGSQVGRYLEALGCELDLRADVLDARWGRGRPPLDSVYLGGGTPSLLAPGQVASILDRVARRYGLATDAEITMEVNPGPDERGDLAGFAAAGVNRLSLGAQRLDAGELRALGRRHAPADVGAAVAEARAAGFVSLNLDLLYDLPGGTTAAWSEALAGALRLGVEHLSLYALTLDDPDAEGLTGPGGDHLPTSRGARRWRERARRGQDEDRAAEQYRLAVDLLATAGYRGYEISNWARPGHESRHNLAYWRRCPYEAAGPGAHAFDGRVRRWTAARLDGYLAALLPVGDAPPRLPPGGSETLDPATAAAEATLLALRLDEGLPVGAAEGGPLGPHLGWALEQRLLARSPDGGRVALTTAGRLLSNEIFARLV
jgi:oxygen-independent coproporphyrinogen-3 oxidase